LMASCFIIMMACMAALPTSSLLLAKACTVRNGSIPSRRSSLSRAAYW
jgi:hypothetical protein